MTLATIRTGLATNLATVTGLNVLISGHWPDTVNPPAALIAPMTGEFHDSMGGDGTKTFEVELVVAAIANGLDNAQTALDPYLDNSGSKSIKAAIEADHTLAGAADSTVVRRWRDYGERVIGTIQYLGVIFDVEVEPVIA